MNKELSYLIYSTPSEGVSVSVVVQGDTIWLTQKAMSELFGVGVPAISKHLKNIFGDCCTYYLSDLLYISLIISIFVSCLKAF